MARTILPVYGEVDEGVQRHVVAVPACKESPAFRREFFRAVVLCLALCSILPRLAWSNDGEAEEKEDKNLADFAEVSWMGRDALQIIKKEAEKFEKLGIRFNSSRLLFEYPCS